MSSNALGSAADESLRGLRDESLEEVDQSIRGKAGRRVVAHPSPRLRSSADDHAQARAIEAATNRSRRMALTPAANAVA